MKSAFSFAIRGAVALFVLVGTLLCIAIFTLNGHVTEGLAEGIGKTEAGTNFADEGLKKYAKEFIPFKRLPKAMVENFEKSNLSHNLPYMAARRITGQRKIGPGMLGWHFSGLIYGLLIKIRLSREEMLEQFFNRAYYGSHNGLAIYGIDAAASAFRGKPVDALNEADSLLLLNYIKIPHH